MKSPSESGTSEPHGHSRQAAPSASGAQGRSGAGGGGLSAVDERALREAQPGDEHDLASVQTVVQRIERADAGAVPIERRAGDAASDHRPQLSDLHESGSIEQDADLVAFI